MSRMHVARIGQIQVGQNVLEPPPLANVRPLPVEIRASVTVVTVTYILKP
ncbi:MAG TPA: hypothetical protein VIW69_16500 [Candidatus Elarobacter sp.]